MAVLLVVLLAFCGVHAGLPVELLGGGGGVPAEFLPGGGATAAGFALLLFWQKGMVFG